MIVVATTIGTLSFLSDVSYVTMPQCIDYRRIAVSWYLPNIILAILFIKFPSLKTFLLMACIARFIFMFLRHIKIVFTSENRWFSLRFVESSYIPNVILVILFWKPKVSQTEEICFNDIYQTFLRSHLVTWPVLTDSALLFPCCWPYLRSAVISLNDEVQNRPSCVDQHLFITAEPTAAKAVSWN